MKTKKGGGVCDHCGYDNQQYKGHPQFLDPGTTLKEKYLLGIPLGNDGFNNTYIAFDLTTKQSVVVKEYFPIGLASRGVDRHHVKPNTDESQNELFVFGKRAFLKEGMSLSDIRMQHIVPVINYFSENNTGYLVTSFIEGTDLSRHLIIKGGRLSIKEAIEIIIPVLSTLHKLHKKNIFHYNLSLSKILFVHQGYPVILGFGQAKQMMDKQSECIRNTIQYENAPPEQYHPKGKFGAWSDVYCCGIILYQMITGIKPQISSLRLKQDQWIPAIHYQTVKISQELSDIIDHAVSVESNNRYKTTREFMKAIKARMPKHTKVPGKTFLFFIILSLFIVGSLGLKFFYFENKQDIRSSVVLVETNTMTQQKELKEPVSSPPKIEEITPVINETPPPDISEAQMQAITPVALPSEEKPSATTVLRICGDRELCDYLAPELANAFLQTKDVDDISKQVDDKENIHIFGKHADEMFQINIETTGTDMAFEGLQYNRCDVLLSGRKIREKERQSFSNTDETDHSETEHIIALDGIVILTHSSNPVRSLDIQAIKDIFSGVIHRWEQVGGREGDIRIYTPEVVSDLYQNFKYHVLGGKDISSDKTFRYLERLSKALRDDPEGIGLCSLPFIFDNQAMAIADHEIDPVRPAYFSISTDEYLLIRNLYLYTVLVSASESTLPFVSFVQSSKGQELIKQCGYVDCSVKALGSRRELWKKPVNPAVFKKLVEITRQTRKLSMNFYFKNNEYQLTPDCHQKLKQLTAWLKHHSGMIKIYVIGYSDSIGSYRQNCIVALKRAEMVAREMKISGIYVDDIVTACEEFPIASNQTEIGRNKNRRVEIWIK
ncbi:MAG: protein kinase [Candidatus Magnetomorum sp.]|nr:protein kinase [Candidatus Magnetomorum sp.]